MARNFATLDDFEFTGKRALVRVDFNVPLNNGKVTDDTRIRAALPTITTLLKEGAKSVILMSHLGRPKGEVKPELSLAPVAQRLQELLGKEVIFVGDCLGKIPDRARIMLLENLRFYKEEKANDAEFTKRLASHADVYVNDAFGTAHRAHASVVGVTEHLPSCAGLLMEKELNALQEVKDSPKQPLILLLGGAKLKTKLPVIEHYLEIADKIIISGAMAFTFFAAKGMETGKSLVDIEFIDKAKALLDNPLFSEKAVFPADFVVASEVSGDAERKVVTADEIPAGWAGLDNGPVSISRFSKLIDGAATVIWNGPLGLCEIQPFDEGTKSIASALAGINAKVVVGGGDTVAVLNDLGLADKYAHLSTGGGAFLDFLAGKELPAVSALEHSKNSLSH